MALTTYLNKTRHLLTLITASSTTDNMFGWQAQSDKLACAWNHTLKRCALSFSATTADPDSRAGNLLNPRGHCPDNDRSCRFQARAKSRSESIACCPLGKLNALLGKGHASVPAMTKVTITDGAPLSRQTSWKAVLGVPCLAYSVQRRRAWSGKASDRNWT